MKAELKEVNTLSQGSVETAHKEIIAQDQAQNKERANQALTILPEEAKQNVMESCKYSSYFPNPITKPFMRKYILSKLEFPTKGSELAQSLTELNVRIDNLFGDAYTFEKTKLEADALDLEIEELDESISKETVNSIFVRKVENQIALKQLELANKKNSLNKTKLAALSRYNEAMGWKGCVEDIMGEMGVNNLDQVNFNSIRMEEMSAKVKKWGELQANEMLEMTPSKLQVIHDSQDDFGKGFYKGKLAIEYQTYQQQIPQLEQQIQDLSIEATLFEKNSQLEEAKTARAQVEQFKKELEGMRTNVSQIERVKAQLEAEENVKTKLLK